MRSVTIAAIAIIIGLSLGACTRQQTDETPPEPNNTEPTAHPTTTQAAIPSSIDDLDLCELLTLEDLPVEPGPDDQAEQELVQGDSRCETTVSLTDPFAIMAAAVSRTKMHFDQFKPPNDNGQFTTIAGRSAYLGHPTSDPRNCVATFGSTDGLLNVSVTDEIQLDVDSCDTVTELAEFVIERTPPPHE